MAFAISIVIGPLRTGLLMVEGSLREFLSSESFRHDWCIKTHDPANKKKIINFNLYLKRGFKSKLSIILKVLVLLPNAQT